MMTDINVGAISEALNNKVDLNQLNTSSAGLSYGSGWAMPSNTYEDLTIGASGTQYTAPANGWVRVEATHANNSNWGGFRVKVLDDANRTMCGFATTTSLSNQGEWFTVPLVKGQKFEITFNDFSIGLIRFIYAKGSESEA